MRILKGFLGENNGVRALAAALSCAVIPLAGCDKAGTSVQEARNDTGAVAMAKRMSRPPLIKVVLQPILAADIASYGVVDGGCEFRRGAAPDAPVIFRAKNDEGLIKLGDELQRLSAKVASPRFEGGAYSSYVGLAYWIDIARQAETPGANSASGPGSGPSGGPSSGLSSGWPARLFVHDAQGRVAYVADGSMTCVDGVPATASSGRPDGIGSTD